MQKVKVKFLPSSVEVDVALKTTIAEAAKDAGINLDLPCGGLGKCGKCLVEVQKGQGAIERTQIKACSYPVEESIIVNLPEKMVNKSFQIMTTGIEKKFSFNPIVSKHFVQLSNISIDNEFITGFQKIKMALKAKGFSEAEYLNIELEAIRKLASLIANKDGFTLVIYGDKVIDVEIGDTTEANYGMAFDIGTTTVVGYLIDLNSGQEVAVASSINRQIKYGADVISRITAALGSAGVEALQKEIVEVLKDLISEAAKKADISKENIYEVVLTGNTSMHHLVLGISPASLGRSPYMPVIKESIEIDAAALGLNINPTGKIYAFPVIAGFVGGDTVAVISACNQHKEPNSRLIIDIGTNGEIVLGSRHRLLTCSTAAGPALEGARITWGMRGAPGAIERVYIDDDLSYEVIGGEKPKGIAGSGIIDLVAEMLNAGVVSYKGRILSYEDGENLPEPLQKRLGGQGPNRYFIVAYKEETDVGEDIVINQKDIQELQLAKGAIRGAIVVLMDHLGLESKDIKEILLAGAFGAHIDVDKGKRIGLLPDFPEVPIRAIGNAAGTGAKLALLSKEEREDLNNISKQVEFVELATQEQFQSEYVKAMFFPKGI